MSVRRETITDEKKSLIPEGRLPYVQIFRVISSRSDDEHILRAFRALTEAQVAGILEPPLTDDLAEAIVSLSAKVTYVPYDGAVFLHEDQGSVSEALYAVFDHGYRVQV